MKLGSLVLFALMMFGLAQNGYAENKKAGSDSLCSRVNAICLLFPGKYQ